MEDRQLSNETRWCVRQLLDVKWSEVKQEVQPHVTGSKAECVLSGLQDVDTFIRRRHGNK